MHILLDNSFAKDSEASGPNQEWPPSLMDQIFHFFTIQISQWNLIALEFKKQPDFYILENILICSQYAIRSMV